MDNETKTQARGHTLGPWRWEGGPNDAGLIRAAAPRGSGWKSVASAHTQENRAEYEANARLIAAAPDYDEGAREAVAHNIAYVYDESGRLLDEWVAIPKTAHRKLRAAIAKARGTEDAS